MGLDRAPIEFQTFYFFHVWLDPPTPYIESSISYPAYIDRTLDQRLQLPGEVELHKYFHGDVISF